MMKSRRFPRLLRPVLYTTAAATALGGTALYISLRPRNIPGSDPALVPPPKYGEEGRLDPPRFPLVRTREEQIRALRRSAGPRGQADLEGQGDGRGLFWWWKRPPLLGSYGEEDGGNERGGGGDVSLASTEPLTGRGEEDGQDKQDQPYDLLIIGGGATGSGIALDAVTRGLRVAVVERDDFASGTSSKSTKLVHGGVRYLEKAVWDLDYNQYVNHLRSSMGLPSSFTC